MKMAKKVATLATTLALVLGSIGTLGVSATGETATETNLITNGGFEDVETRMLEEAEYKWPAKTEDEKEVWNANSSLTLYGKTVEGVDAVLTNEVENVRTGEYALKVVTESSENYKRRIWQRVDGLTAGKWYEASVWVKGISNADDTVTKNKNQGAQIRVGRSDAGGVDLGTENGWYATSSESGTGHALLKTNNTWTQIMVRWQQPASYGENSSFDGTYTYLALEMGYLSGYENIYYFDDVCMREITGFNGNFEQVTTEKYSTENSCLWPQGVGAGFKNVTFVGTDAVATGNDKYAGNYSLKLQNSGAMVTMLVPNLEAGRSYTITAYVKVKGSSSNAKLLAGPTITGADSTMWRSISGIKTTDGWVKKESAFTVAEGYNYAWLNIYAGTLEEDSYVCWDDISVTENIVEFTNSDGVTLSKSEDGEIAVSGWFINPNAEKSSGTLVVATYSMKSGVKQLINVSTKQSSEINANAATKISTKVTATKGNIIKAMILDDITNLKPVINAVELPAGE